MKEDDHERAKKLIDTGHVEGLEANDRAWLDEHLEACPGCAARAQVTERALKSLRLAVAPVSPSLVSSTQQRVRLRARELREQRARMRALWLSCALSWMLGVLTAPLLWWALEGLARRTDLPKAIWLAAFPLLWTVPAAAVSAVLVWWRARTPSENGFRRERS
jgi:anti-sigma factor RsiW